MVEFSKKVIIILIVVAVIAVIIIILGLALGLTLGKNIKKANPKATLSRAYKKLAKITNTSVIRTKQAYAAGSTDVKIPVRLSQVNFYLYTRQNRDVPFVIEKSDITNLSDSNFVPTKKTVVISHGWQNDHSSPINTLIKGAVLEKYDMNIIVVGWGSVAKMPYEFSKNTVPSVGEIVGMLISKLQKKFNLGGNSFILIGHSLGAHVVGNAGRRTKKKVGYIVGLDPAGMLFNLNMSRVLLRKSDGKYVQAIHTNGERLGLVKPLGHIDFYPNTGLLQPGCGVDAVGTCSHSKSYEYFAESITRGRVFRAVQCSDPKTFLSGSCDNNQVAFMGGLFPYDPKKTGLFFLKTNPNPPYGMYEET